MPDRQTGGKPMATILLIIYKNCPGSKNHRQDIHTEDISSLWQKQNKKLHKQDDRAYLKEFLERTSSFIMLIRVLPILVLRINACPPPPRQTNSSYCHDVLIIPWFECQHASPELGDQSRRRRDYRGRSRLPM